MVLLIPHKGTEGEREGKGRRKSRMRNKIKGNKKNTMNSTLIDERISINSCRGYSELKYFIQTSFKEKQNIAPIANKGPKSFVWILTNLNIAP